MHYLHGVFMHPNFVITSYSIHYTKLYDDKSLVKNAPHKWVKLGATEEAIKLLKSEKVTDIVMAGAIKRPGLFDIKLDLRTMQLIAEVGTSALGDDKLLKAISNEFEREGFKIMAAHA